MENKKEYLYIAVILFLVLLPKCERILENYLAKKEVVAEISPKTSLTTTLDSLKILKKKVQGITIIKTETKVGIKEPLHWVHDTIVINGTPKIVPHTTFYKSNKWYSIGGRISDSLDLDLSFTDEYHVINRQKNARSPITTEVRSLNPHSTSKATTISTVPKQEILDLQLAIVPGAYDPFNKRFVPLAIGIGATIKIKEIRKRLKKK